MIFFNLKDTEFEIVCDELKRHKLIGRPFRVVKITNITTIPKAKKQFVFLSGEETNIETIEGRKYVEVIVYNGHKDSN